MKTKSFFAALMLLFCTTSLWASDTSVDGIWYDFNSSTKTATVTYRGKYNNDYVNEYSGNVTIPASVTYSGKNYSVTSIGESAFYKCSSLTSVTIPNSVTSIGKFAFDGCSSLTSVTIGNSVTSIGDYAFRDCRSLTSVEIPNSVTSIGEFAFFKCSSLTSVTIGNSVTSIGGSAFVDCTSLTSVTIGNSVTSIGNSAFSGCSGLTSVTIPNSVTSIGVRAFAGCSSLTSVTIPNSVTSIGNSAFYDCSSLTSVEIPNSITSIGQYAFCNCSSLTSVTIPNSVTSIGDVAFADCSGLTSVTIPNSVTSIGRSAFQNCSSLTSVTIPNSVTSIGEGAFGGVNNIIYSGTATGSPWGAKSVNGYVDGYLVYSDATKTTLLGCSVAATGTIVIPNSVTSIGSYAFNNCKSLTSVTIPNSVTSIGESAFYACSGLTKVNITDIAAWCNIAFGNELSNPLCNAKHLFVNDVEVTDLVVPNGVTSIGNYAFSDCSSLTSVTIGNSVTNIGRYAFNECSQLKNILFGASVKVIEASAFSECSALEAITCYSMRPPTVNYGTLQTLPNNIIIYVPADYLNTYKMHDFWGMYDVRPIGAATAETTNVQVTPGETTATIVWPTVGNAATYEMVIKDKNGNVVCTLIFNSNGQLTEIAFNAPARDNATQAAGFSFTVTGLEEGTSYNLTITAKDGNGTKLDEKTIAFNTTGGTGVEDINIPAISESSTKIIRNGEVLILRGGKTYTLQGVEVK